MMKGQLNFLSERVADWTKSSPLTWWYWPSEVWDTEEKIGWRNGERQSSGSRVSLPNCGHYVHPNCSGWQSSLTIVLMCLDISFNNIFLHIEAPMEIPNGGLLWKSFFRAKHKELSDSENFLPKKLKSSSLRTCRSAPGSSGRHFEHRIWFYWTPPVLLAPHVDFQSLPTSPTYSIQC